MQPIDKEQGGPKEAEETHPDASSSEHESRGGGIGDANGDGKKSRVATLNMTERWLVLAIVAGVAIHQFVATAKTTLSPWKGGGFGMFAVSDSPGTRFVRAEGITNDGRRIRIDALEGLEREVRRRWRSRPLNSQLESLADDLMDREFVRTNLRSISAINQLQREVPVLSETLKLEEESRTQMRFYRSRREDDPIPEKKFDVDGDPTIHLKAIELQWWKIEFDSEGRKLRPVPLFPPVQRGSWSDGTSRSRPSAGEPGADTDGTGTLSVERPHPAPRDQEPSTSPSPGGR